MSFFTSGIFSKIFMIAKSNKVISCIESINGFKIFIEKNAI